MSDKTKMHHDQALIRRRFAEQQARDAAKPKHDLRCQCGNSSHETKLWAVSPFGLRPGAFYCVACIPYELLADIMVEVANMPDEA